RFRQRACFHYTFHHALLPCSVNRTPSPGRPASSGASGPRFGSAHEATVRAIFTEPLRHLYNVFIAS
ncbi:MAG: hypothetical protein KM312_11625, partial [Hydrogenibacillus schlegelii]|nr:hypothetical protein [Hydrogenibacillus schlegelii]